MKRDYHTGTQEETVFFIGKEIEHTPAYGMRTLFVVGVHDVNDIEKQILDHGSVLDPNKDIRHIFFGANHSYNPNLYEEYKEWENMIIYFLNKGYFCSLDIPITQAEEFNEGGLCEWNNFIPQIRVPIPYVRLWNYNTMIKIDDTGFNATNPGVWTHSLHKLMDRDCFTSWDQYKNDEVIK